MNLLQEKKQALPLLMLGGVAAGFLNGLLGAGGGIIIVFVLKKALGERLMDSRDVFANTVAIVLALCTFSLFHYSVSGTLSLRGASFFILPAILGGLAGALLLDKLKTSAIQALFGILILISGLFMVAGR